MIWNLSQVAVEGITGPSTAINMQNLRCVYEGSRELSNYGTAK